MEGGMVYAPSMEWDATVLTLKVQLQAVTFTLHYFMKLLLHERELEDEENLEELATTHHQGRLNITFFRVGVNHDEWLPRVRSDLACLLTAPKHVCADPAVIDAAICSTGRHFLGEFHPLSVAAPEIIDEALADLQAEPVLALAAARSPGFPLTCTVFLDLLHEAKDFRSNREVFSEALLTDGRALSQASMELRADKQICRLVVSTYGYALRWVMPPLQDDADVVEAAVRQDGHALQFASDCRRADPQIARTALQQNPAALMWLPAALQNDPELVLVSVHSDGSTLRWAGPMPRSDIEVVLAAVSSNGLALQWASAELRENREIVVAAIRNEGCALRYAGAALQEDRDVVLTAVSQDDWALRWAAYFFSF
eukprot:TRINITY_DN19854_c0_g3_i1.p1 TRINITY_DN19854_c0_g3~~TRINITY_DN19854_c0_g3_i1.p1  ORF type:complete len:401 (+),score=45.54 TRINITY_DN19854_c0_g3_i1:95-1204(+)